ncbi:lipopolysaccharide assembly protein LapA domain-containing protein [Paenibacillus chondroitinus]|uniref:Lipopolysaccharide assembly protein LapA domain-containing protein n=1 Tax=Paenibacillus chondroitinus TaxID=59842 RepID=A0ABU6D7B4_9BACL|nr:MULTISPECIES: lipopolysaccharide assembly protein LapA domain-containing protein [Paenibacillus]MCY9662560.1 lipopolysaccharide assembly protein LapA domain-containing protein [Paenibacillus anseongense]MEB4793325.1 lipopolysaccharide assembly protein LapA domain-containing protein [Paenibacillus chondroitinus]
MKMQWILICALIFALLTAVFAVVNVEPVQVNFIFAQTSTPLILVILTSTLLGGLIVGLFGMVRQYKLNRKVKHLEKQLQDAVSPPAEQPVRETAGEASPTVH